MKYPIDSQTTEAFFNHLVTHDRAQRQYIQALTILLQTAMEEMGMDDTEWYPEAEKLLAFQKKLDVDHANRIFNEKSGHVLPTEAIAVPGVTISREGDAALSQLEAEEFGKEMTEEEIAAVFREKVKPKAKDTLDLKKKDLTIEEIEDWEAKQNNSNDIYKVKARVANLARGGGASLTPVGEMMVNTFVHVVKDLYDFAETIEDKTLRIKLIERIRKHENMPGNLIAATSSNVRTGK